MKLRLLLWLSFLGVCAWLVLRTPVVADLTAFLPSTATRSQQLLVEQLKSGVAARLMLVAVEGNAPRTLAEVSRKMVQGLRDTGLFNYANNGDAQSIANERELLLRHRYLLSPAVTPDHFSVPALREALQNDLELLASPAGALVKPVMAQDPSGELSRLMTSFGGSPEERYGAWFSHDGKRALLIAETKAAGFDVEAQSRAAAAASRAFTAARPLADMHLLLTGPGVFAAESRAIIERDSWRLTLIAAVLVFAILFSVYRSFTVLALGLLPVVSGLLAGIAVVGLVFGMVHGITLGFAATLIGEAVDYPSYLFTHVAKGERVADTLKRIWPTLRLAVLTTVFGGLTMLLSSFNGLSQLGLLSMTGVLVAGTVTRWILPLLAPEGFAPRQLKPVAGLSWLSASQIAARGVGVVLIAACVILIARREVLWDDDLANLNPIPEAAKRLDKELRNELGAPDVRDLVVVTGREREEVLQRSETVAQTLHGLAARKFISGFEGAFQYLPSQKKQAERRAALPDNITLRKNLNEALRGLPFREGLFAPFLNDVEAARLAPLMQERDLQGTAFALKVNSLLFRSGGEWVALLPLRGVEDPAGLAQQFAPIESRDVILLDLKAESNRLINGYRNESLRLTGLGILAITLVLTWGLRQPGRIWRVLKPVLAALVVTLASLLVVGERLNLFHLVSLLLVLGIGLNYALFFNREAGDAEDRQRTHLALIVCSLTTLSAFGCLAFSQTPVLHAIGLTVSLGAVFSLLISAAWARSRIS